MLVCKASDFSVKLNKSLAGSGVPGCRFFPFITLNVSCHSHLAFRVPAEISDDSLMGVTFYVICGFSFVAVGVLSLSLIFVALITVSWCVPL